VTGSSNDAPGIGSIICSVLSSVYIKGQILHVTGSLNDGPGIGSIISSSLLA